LSLLLVMHYLFRRIEIAPAGQFVMRPGNGCEELVKHHVLIARNESDVTGVDQSATGLHCDAVNHISNSRKRWKQTC
jgi:hypothetical protein